MNFEVLFVALTPLEPFDPQKILLLTPNSAPKNDIARESAQTLLPQPPGKIPSNVTVTK